jgi:hypothetical protein
MGVVHACEPRRRRLRPSTSSRQSWRLVEGLVVDQPIIVGEVSKAIWQFVLVAQKPDSFEASDTGNVIDRAGAHRDVQRIVRDSEFTLAPLHVPVGWFQADRTAVELRVSHSRHRPTFRRLEMHAATCGRFSLERKQHRQDTSEFPHGAFWTGSEPCECYSPRLRVSA